MPIPCTNYDDQGNAYVSDEPAGDPGCLPMVVLLSLLLLAYICFR